MQFERGTLVKIWGMTPTISLLTRKAIVPPLTSTIAPAIARKGLLRSIGTWPSSFMSKTIKSVGIYIPPTSTGMSSMNPTGCMVVRSANFKVTSVGFNSPIAILLQRDKGNKLILAPKFHMALSMVSLPITQGIEKLPGSPSFGGSFLMIALLSLVKAIVSLCFIFLFF